MERLLIKSSERIGIIGATGGAGQKRQEIEEITPKVERVLASMMEF